MQANARRVRLSAAARVTLACAVVVLPSSLGGAAALSERAARAGADLGAAIWTWGALVAGGTLVTVFAAVSLLVGLRARRLARAVEAANAGELATTIEVAGSDELGRAGAAISALLERLHQSYQQLREALQAVAEATTRLSSHASEQGEAITHQATALHEAQVTAEEIRQTSKVAAQKAESVLKVSLKAEEVSKLGTHDIELFIEGFASIRGTVDELARTIVELRNRARQIGEITKTVKGLADQSNMVALNAAIEAVRSGEHGKGFAIVAGEVRNLADQSIHATKRVREILEDIAAAIAQANAVAETGTRALETGLSQVTSSSESLRVLSSLVKDSSAAVRQISAAVGQQDAGIDQIFAAVNELNALMGEAAAKKNPGDDPAAALRAASGRAGALLEALRAQGAPP